MRFLPCVLVLLLAPAPAPAQIGRIPIPLPGQRQPTPAEREFAAGDALLQQGDLDGARARFLAAQRLDPRDARPVFYLGEVELRSNHLAASESHFRAALRLDPAMSEAHAELGAVLRELHRCDDAIPELETALRLAPSLGEAHHALALCLEDRGDVPRALQEFRAAARLLTDDPMPSLNLGLLLAGQRPPRGSPLRNEALRALHDAVRRGARTVTVLASAGPAFRMLGEHRTAVETLERARALGPPAPALLGELAQALWAAGDRGPAEQRITEALALAPREASLHYLHALMLADAHDAARAAQELRAVTRLAQGTALADRAADRLRDLTARRPAAPP